MHGTTRRSTQRRESSTAGSRQGRAPLLESVIGALTLLVVQYHDGNGVRDEAGFKKLAATNSGDACLVQVPKMSVADLIWCS